jgi:rhodanese-related sulfurtransferase
MEKLKPFALLICGVIVLVLIPILFAAAPAATVESESVVISTAADSYMNDEDTVWNTSSAVLLAEILDDDPYIIDLRASADYATGHIHGAINMSTADLFTAKNMAKLPKDEPIYVYCYTGHSGSQVAAMLNLCGYDGKNVQWGIMGWTKDETVATKQFTNPATDLATETTANVPTVTYTVPTVENTSSGDEAEVIRVACENYASAGLNFISAAALNTLITDADTTNDPVIVSVRAASAYEAGHIPGAINIPLRDIAKEVNLEKLDPDKQIVVYCYTGRTASQATGILNVLGYNATSLLWGISGWTTDATVAPSRFNPDTSVDYPFETGAGSGGSSGGDGGGGCG